MESHFPYTLPDLVHSEGSVREQVQGTGDGLDVPRLGIELVGDSNTYT